MTPVDLDTERLVDRQLQELASHSHPWSWGPLSEVREALVFPLDSPVILHLLQILDPRP